MVRDISLSRKCAPWIVCCDRTAAAGGCAEGWHLVDAPDVPGNKVVASDLLPGAYLEWKPVRAFTEAEEAVRQWFRAAVAPGDTPATHTSMRWLFDGLDSDGDGRVTDDDWLAVFEGTC